MCNKSVSIKELAGALAKAQGEMKAAAFDAVNPFLKNKYASLGSIIESTRPILAKNGLAVSQLTITQGEQVGVTTILMHQSGEWIESTATLPTGDEKGKSSAQVAGSVITYLRRYSLASVLGMYADEDTDGQGGEKKGAPQKQENEQLRVDKPSTKPENGNGKMSLEMAKEVKSGDGKLYWDMDIKELSFHFNGHVKALRSDELTTEERLDREFKKDAAQLLIDTKRAAKGAA